MCGCSRGVTPCGSCLHAGILAHRRWKVFACGVSTGEVVLWDIRAGEVMHELLVSWKSLLLRRVAVLPACFRWARGLVPLGAERSRASLPLPFHVIAPGGFVPPSAVILPLFAAPAKKILVAR